MSDTWISEFSRLCIRPDASIEDVKRAFQLKNENLPRFLYRYRPPKPHSIQELEHDSVFVSQPSGQNDPLDSICTISMTDVFRAIARKRAAKTVRMPGIADRLTEEQRQICERSEDPESVLYESLINSSAPDEKEELIKLINSLKEFARRESEKLATTLGQLAHNHLRICCFTLDYQSASMWDRYAAGHKGICVAYDLSLFPSDELRRRWLYPVIYRDTPFDLTAFLIANLEWNSVSPLWPVFASIHKSSDWSNEKEWRLVMPLEVNPTPKLEFFLKPSAVYLGSQMEHDMQQYAEEIAHRRGISIFKMEVSYRERRMTANPR